MSAEPDVPFQTLCVGDASTQPVDGVWAVRNSREWQQSWEQLESGRRSQPPILAVDWEADMVIVFALGVRGSGGFDARIERLSTDQETMHVFACGQRPGPSCVTTQALTNPYHAITTGRRELPLRLVRRVGIVECD